jgi:hypothetical protein
VGNAVGVIDFTEVTDFTEVIMDIGMIPLRQDAELPPIQM